MFGKGIQRLAAYTGYMPIMIEKGRSFLDDATEGRFVKEAVGSRIGLNKKGNKVIFHGSFLIHIEIKPPVHCLELIVCFIHIVSV